MVSCWGEISDFPIFFLNQEALVLLLIDLFTQGLPHLQILKPVSP